MDDVEPGLQLAFGLSWENVETSCLRLYLW